MIAVGNSVAMNASHPESDIDLFVVTEIKRLWLVRILLTLSLQIMHARKTSKHHAGRFCLSFFCTTEALDFASFALKDDIYLYFRIVMLKPIINVEDTHAQFLASQSWADFSLYPDIQKLSTSFQLSLPSKKHTSPLTRKFFDTLDSICKFFFLPKTLHHAQRIGNPYGIIITKHMLKFHDDDQRKEISEKIRLKSECRNPN